MKKKKPNPALYLSAKQGEEWTTIKIHGCDDTIHLPSSRLPEEAIRLVLKFGPELTFTERPIYSDDSKDYSRCVYYSIMCAIHQYYGDITVKIREITTNITT